MGDYFISSNIDSKDWEIYDKEKEIGHILINQEQCFDGKPLEICEFYNKWLSIINLH